MFSDSYPGVIGADVIHLGILHEVLHSDHGTVYVNPGFFSRELRLILREPWVHEIDKPLKHLCEVRDLVQYIGQFIDAICIRVKAKDPALETFVKEVAEGSSRYALTYPIGFGIVAVHLYAEHLSE